MSVNSRTATRARTDDLGGVLVVDAVHLCRVRIGGYIVPEQQQALLLAVVAVLDLTRPASGCS
jgi:hypothetical protein